MDNYRLEEVKTIIDKNLLSPEVLENILKNSTKRIELYNDYEAVKILRYLIDEEIIPEGTKGDIEKYLVKYDNFIADGSKKEEKDKNKTTRIVILYTIVLVLCIILVWINFIK